LDFRKIGSQGPFFAFLIHPPPSPYKSTGEIFGRLSIFALKTLKTHPLFKEIAKKVLSPVQFIACPFIRGEVVI